MTPVSRIDTIITLSFRVKELESYLSTIKEHCISYQTLREEIGAEADRLITSVIPSIVDHALRLEKKDGRT